MFLTIFPGGRSHYSVEARGVFRVLNNLLIVVLASIAILGAAIADFFWQGREMISKGVCRERGCNSDTQYTGSW